MDYIREGQEVEGLDGGRQSYSFAFEVREQHGYGAQNGTKYG